MIPTFRNATFHRAPTLGFIAFACLHPMASTFGAETTSPTGTAEASVDMDGNTTTLADAVLAKSPVSYSTEQTKRGKKKYKKECQECHGDNLKGGDKLSIFVTCAKAPVDREPKFSDVAVTSRVAVPVFIFIFSPQY